MTVEKFRGGEGREARLRKRNWGYLYYEIPKVEKELAFRSVFCAAKCLDRQSRSEKESLRPFSHRGSKATADRKGQTPEIAERQKEPQYSHQRGTSQPLVPTWWQRGCPYVVRTTTRPQLRHKKKKKVWRLAGLIFLRWKKPHEWWAEFGKWKVEIYEFGLNGEKGEKLSTINSLFLIAAWGPSQLIINMSLWLTSTNWE